MTTREFNLSLSDEVMGYLQREAGHRNISLDDVLSDVVAEYFDELTKEDILASLKQGMEQAVAGNVRPAHEVMDEIEREMGDNANEG